YLEEYCRDHATKEAILFFLIVLTDLKQVLDFLYDHDILKNRSVMQSMLKAENLMFDHFERVVVGPPAQDSTDLLLSTDAKQEEFQVWELVVKAADSYSPPASASDLTDVDYWGTPLIRVVDSLKRSAQKLLLTDWRLIAGGFDWREELLEQFDPPDPYEAEEFVNTVDLDDVSIGSGSVVAAHKSLRAEDHHRALDGELNISDYGSYRSEYLRFFVHRGGNEKRCNIKGRGGYADVRIGEWLPPGTKTSMVVAIKYPRPVGLGGLEEHEQLEALLKRLYQEVSRDLAIHTASICPSNPGISDNPESVHSSTVVQWTLQLARIAEVNISRIERDPGLTAPVTQQDNILVNDDEDPVLADFGLAEIARDVLVHNPTSPEAAKGTPIWMAPELYEEDAKISAASDVYAFAFLVIQLYSERLPFFDILQLGSVQLMLAVLTGIRPKREDYPVPPYLVDRTTEYEGLWPLLAKWWEQDPSHRPAAETVQRELRGRLNEIDV
ncbi:hypothetical protein FRB90_009388, partial [Tulasnella sp. 427]